MGKIVFWALAYALAFSAGGPVGTLAVLGLWLVVAYLPGKKAQAREEARFFQETIDSSDLSDVRCTVDFEEMVMTRRFRSAGEPDEEETCELERAGEGQWRYAGTGKRRREEDWQPIRGGFASRLEVAYQRYLRTLLGRCRAD